MRERLRKFWFKLRNKFTLRFIVPVEYKLIGITPLSFTLGVLSDAGIDNFIVNKVKGNYIDIVIKNINRNMAISVAKEFVFAKAMIIQSILTSELDIDIKQFGSIICMINAERVDSVTCKMFEKTGELVGGSESNLKRLCENRGVVEDDELY